MSAVGVRVMAVGGALALATLVVGCSAGREQREAASSTVAPSGASTSPPAPAAPATADPASLRDGPSIFRTKCASCHGRDGAGDLGPALKGVADRLTRSEQIAVVSQGRGTMLAFSPALTDDQIAAVVDYIRTDLS